MPPATDKFSTLPDAILCSILSKIPIKEAIRSSLLSKRWRFLYTQMPQLILSPHLLLGPLHPDPLSIATVENIISKILLLHSSDLEVFYLSIDVYPSARICNINTQWRFTRDSVYKWVRCAAWRNVQHLTLCDSPEREIPPPALFSCTRLITLTLYNYILSPLPTHFYGFNHLTTCNFNYVELTDQSLAQFVSHCPLLQNLSLHKCVGLQQPTISAPNITDLGVSDSVEALTVNCPKLNTLQAYLIKDLRVNGILFHEISCSIWELNMQGGSNLIGLKVESSSDEFISAERFIDIIGSFKLLKLLVVFVGPLLKSEKEMDISLLSVFDRLPHLEELYMGENFLSASRQWGMFTWIVYSMYLRRISKLLKLLYNYILSPLPTHFYGFNHLTTCNFNYVELTDQSLAQFVSHCPLLQNLSLHKCVGLQQPTISAPNITDLGVCDSVEALTVNCPKLNTLKAYLIKDLRVNGILFHEISCSIWELNMQGGSNLIGLKVESSSDEFISAERFIDIIGSFKLLKLLVVFVGPLLKSEKEMDISLLSVFDRLPHLEELYMGENFLSELANHAISLSLNSPLCNLRKIRVYIHLDGTSDREICVLGCLLQSTPALQVMELQLTDDADSESPMYAWFLEKVLYLNRASKQARIVI